MLKLSHNNGRKSTRKWFRSFAWLGKSSKLTETVSTSVELDFRTGAYPFQETDDLACNKLPLENFDLQHTVTLTREPSLHCLSNINCAAKGLHPIVFYTPEYPWRAPDHSKSSPSSCHTPPSTRCTQGVHGLYRAGCWMQTDQTQWCPLLGIGDRWSESKTIITILNLNWKRGETWQTFDNCTVS